VLRHRFVVEVDPIPDALVRVLGPFAVQQVTVAAVRYEQTDCGGFAVLEILGLDPDKAGLLERRLEQLSFVRNVTLAPLRAGRPELLINSSGSG
jgi:acetolactate synthase regulatory subunit